MNFETFNIPVSKIRIENISAESQEIISQKCRYLKISVSKSIVNVIKHVNFRAYYAEVISKNGQLTKNT